LGQRAIGEAWSNLPDQKPGADLDFAELESHRFFIRRNLRRLVSLQRG
jgi:hypothetical protein